MGLLTACSLDEHPKRITAEGLAEDPESAEQLVTGVYSLLWTSELMTKVYGEWTEYDQDLVVGFDWALNSTGAGNPTGHWAYNSDKDPFLTFYIMIARCNAAAEALKPNIGNSSIAQLYGEVLFLRAWSYFHLVRMYGPVPLRLESVTPNDVARSSVPDVYACIELDLKDAIANMQYAGAAEVGAFGHADKTAAQLLLARVYCTMASGKVAGGGVNMYAPILNEASIASNPDPAGDMTIQPTMMQFTTKKVMGEQMTDGYAGFDANELYGEAEKLCDDIIGRRGESFDLMDGWDKLWGGNNRRNKEFVWGASSYNMKQYQNAWNSYYTTYTTWGGLGVIALSDLCWKAYAYNPTAQVNDDRAVKGVFHYLKDATADQKRQWFRFPSGDPNYNTAPDGLKPDDSSDFVIDGTLNNSWHRTAPWSTKWYTGDISNQTVVYERQAEHIEQDVILMRFAEAYLLRAEARNELDNISGAREDLNEIRGRANASLIPETVTDKDQLRSYIFMENGLEFVLEFKRKFDLLRWGMYLNVMNATQTQLDPHNDIISRVREEKCVLYPVPQAETSQNKLFGENNPGW
jgi:hypothetical protein